MELPQNADMAQLKAISAAVKRYYSQAPIQFLPSPNDFASWLATLPENQRLCYASRGMTRCGRVFQFKRFYYEKNGHRLDDYLKRCLRPEDYAVWVLLGV